MLETETIDETIGQIERLYRTLTGRQAPPAGEKPYAAIPPERAPEDHVQEQLDRLVESLGEFSGKTTVARWTPPLSLWETQREIVLCVDLPGVPRDSIQLRVANGLTEITGERVNRRADESSRLLHCEHGTGPFRRLLPLPPGVAIDEIQAQLKDGVLEIRMPKGSAAGEGRSIPLS